MQSEFEKARERILASLELLEKKGYKSDCGDLIDNWIELGRDANPLHTLVIDLGKLSQRNFMEKYFLFSEDEETASVNEYWADLSHVALRLLVKEYVNEVSQILQTLQQQYNRFPLARPRTGVKELTLQEIGAVHDILKKIVKPPAENIGVKPIDKELESLRKPALGKEKWLESLLSVIDALPQNQPFNCKILILSAQQQKRLLQNDGKEFENDRLGLVWSVVGLMQGQTQKGKIRADQLDDKLLGELSYPGDQVALHIYTHTDSQEPDRILNLDSLWACILLLHDGQLRDTKGEPKWRVGERLEDGQKWNIELTFQDNLAKLRSFWIQLIFDRPLPQITQWPDIDN